MEGSVGYVVLEIQTRLSLEPCWIPLRKKVRRMRILGTSPEEDYKTRTCLSCNVKDISQYAVVKCKGVREVWEGATSWLCAMIGWPNIAAELTIPEIVLGFSQLRNSLPKTMRERVKMWHSAVVFIIAHFRMRV